MNIHVVLAPDQWRGEGPPGQVAMQIIRDRIAATDDPEWAAVEGWRCFPGDPSHYPARVQVRADVLPPEARPGLRLVPARWVRLPGTKFEVLLHGKFGTQGGVEVVRNHARAEYGGWDLRPVEGRYYVRAVRS